MSSQVSLSWVRVALFPTFVYANFPSSIVEAFAKGVPLIASRVSGPAKIVEDGVTELHAIPGDASDWAEKIELVWANLERFRVMRQLAHRCFVQNHTSQRNYEILRRIYVAAISHNCFR